MTRKRNNSCLTLNQLYVLLIACNTDYIYSYGLQGVFKKIGTNISPQGSGSVLRKLYELKYIERVDIEILSGDNRNSNRHHYQVTDEGQMAAHAELRRLIYVKRNMR